MWNPEKPIIFLPENIRIYYVNEAKYLVNDLEKNKLSVVLVPAPDPRHHSHKIRVAASHNPTWYSDLYWSYNHFRRDKSIKALNRIINEKDEFQVYDNIYRTLIHERLIEGDYDVQQYIRPPNNIVRTFFNMPSIDSFVEQSQIEHVNIKEKDYYIAPEPVPF